MQTHPLKSHAIILLAAGPAVIIRIHRIFFCI
jgi:hypothetical protein